MSSLIHETMAASALELELRTTAFSPYARDNEIRFKETPSLIRVVHAHVWQPATSGGSTSTWIAHIDVTFALNETRPDSIIIDCATGTGVSISDALGDAVRSWFITSLPPILSLLSSTAIMNAIHFEPHDPAGFAGWSGFLGPYYFRGDTADVQKLQDRLLASPWLSQLRSSLPSTLARPMLNSIKLFYGSPRNNRYASCFINGQPQPEVEAAILKLDWPEVNTYASVSQFVLLLLPHA
jgi:hypothetical protein